MSETWRKSKISTLNIFTIVYTRKKCSKQIAPESVAPRNGCNSLSSKWGFRTNSTRQTIVRVSLGQVRPDARVYLSIGFQVVFSLLKKLYRRYSLLCVVYWKLNRNEQIALVYDCCECIPPSRTHMCNFKIEKSKKTFFEGKYIDDFPLNPYP